MEQALATEQTTDTIFNAKELLRHWQGHRGLTRRVIEAFPEDKLFTYSIGGMRPFGEMAIEMLDQAGPGMVGIVTRQWPKAEDMSHISGKNTPATREELLRMWDETTEKINELRALIPPGRFSEVDLAFGQWEAPVYGTLFYFIDNEIHHRGQGYVYLRSLGIEPPPFWDRA